MDLLVAPVYRSILFPPMVLGMPRRMFVVIGVTTLAVVLGAGAYWFLAVTVVALLAARAIGKVDRYAFEIFTEFNRLPSGAD